MSRTETMLMKINIEGRKYHLEMMDGSRWFVSPGDLPTAAIWIPASDVEIVSTGAGGPFAYQISNLSDDTIVFAMRVK